MLSTLVTMNPFYPTNIFLQNNTHLFRFATVCNILYLDLNLETQCTLGCNKCGYNWYQQQWKNGQPTKFFQNRDCGCCQIGGDMNAFDDCRYYCTGRSPPKEGK